MKTLYRWLCAACRMPGSDGSTEAKVVLIVLPLLALYLLAAWRGWLAP